ncbi:putative transposon Ty3-I Gag-Pol polyprotein, partial [Operophtera brumata]
MNENKLIGEGNQELAPDAPPEYGALPSSSIASSSSSSSSPAAPRREGRWSNGERVRYVETEKKYVARPGFYELDVNTELRHFDSNSNWLRLLDRSFGAMTHALVQQNELLKQNFQQLIEWSQLPTTALSADTLFEKMHSLFSEKSTYIKVSEDLLQLICGRRADIIQRRRDCILSSVKDKYIKHDLSKIPPTNANLFNPQQLGTFLEKAGGTNKLFTAQKRSAEEPHQMSMRNRQGGPQAKRPRRSFRNAEPDYDPQPSTSSRAATFKDFKGKNQKNFDNRRPKQDYIQVWEAISAPNHILKLIRGYRIPFQVKPPLQNPNLLKRFQTPTSSSMSEQIITLKNQKVLIPVKLATPSFVSPMFLIKKSDSSNRPIFDLQNLNDYVSVVKFRLINVQRVPTFLQANDWVVKIDLTQAYFHLPIAQSHQRYLRVLYTPEATRRPELLQITCLPFGLSSSPKAFATVSNWVAHLLRTKGLRIIVYLDDFLIAHQDRHMLQDQAAEAIRVLTLLGWMVNFQKSVLNPTKVIEYLGISWNLHMNSKQLPIDKVLRISARIQGLLRDNRWSVKQAQCILGMLNFAAFVVPRGRLRCRPIQMAYNKLPKHDPFLKFRIDPQAATELSWWLETLTQSTPIHQRQVSHHITTDASGKGWGALVDNLPGSGIWSPEQKLWHSNLKE